MNDALNDLLGLSSPPKRVQCKTCQTIIAAPELQQGVDHAVSMGATQKDIVAVLSKHGYDVTESSLKRHLKEGHKPL